MKSRNLTLFTAMALFAALAITVQVFAQTSPSKHKIFGFDAPGAGTGSGEGTLANDINPAGEITGLTRDANMVRHGFVRAKHGKITVFDDANAGTGSGQGTRGYSINPKGWITGWFHDATTGAARGYVRAPNGKITNFDAPHAGKGPYPQGTFAWGLDVMNPSGAITGFYADSSNAQHGFLRAPDGTITEFDAPGAAATGGFGINPAGAITGDDCSPTKCYGFLRSPKGHFTKFGVPGAVNGTFPEYINAAGAITGVWVDGSGANHGFLRAPDGKITEFDPPGAGKGNLQGTTPWAINDKGVLSGRVTPRAAWDHGHSTPA